MARIKYVDGNPIALTAEENVARDADEQAWENAELKRTAMVEIRRLEGEVTQRRLREAALGADGGWLANQDALIAAERLKL